MSEMELQNKMSTEEMGMIWRWANGWRCQGDVQGTSGGPISARLVLVVKYLEPVLTSLLLI